jgi:hypothetical protein
MADPTNKKLCAGGTAGGATATIDLTGDDTKEYLGFRMTKVKPTSVSGRGSGIVFIVQDKDKRPLVRTALSTSLMDALKEMNTGARVEYQAYPYKCICWIFKFPMPDESSDKEYPAKLFAADLGRAYNTAKIMMDLKEDEDDIGVLLEVAKHLLQLWQEKKRNMKPFIQEDVVRELQAELRSPCDREIRVAELSGFDDDDSINTVLNGEMAHPPSTFTIEKLIKRELLRRPGTDRKTAGKRVAAADPGTDRKTAGKRVAAADPGIDGKTAGKRAAAADSVMLPRVKSRKKAATRSNFVGMSAAPRVKHVAFDRSTHRVAVRTNVEHINKILHSSVPLDDRIDELKAKLAEMRDLADKMGITQSIQAGPRSVHQKLHRSLPTSFAGTFNVMWEALRKKDTELFIVGLQSYQFLLHVFDW